MLPLPKVSLISNGAVLKAVSALADILRSSVVREAGIVAVGRGGLIPARLLTDTAGFPLVGVLGADAYEAVAQPRFAPRIRPLYFLQDHPEPLRGAFIILVDDIADSGRTLMAAKASLEKSYPETDFTTATLWQRALARGPEYTAVQLHKRSTRWLVFPWDYYETLVDLARRAGWPKTDVDVILTRLEVESGWKVEKGTLKRALDRAT